MYFSLPGLCHFQCLMLQKLQALLGYLQALLGYLQAKQMRLLSPVKWKVYHHYATVIIVKQLAGVTRVLLIKNTQNSIFSFTAKEVFLNREVCHSELSPPYLLFYFLQL